MRSDSSVLIVFGAVDVPCVDELGGWGASVATLEVSSLLWTMSPGTSCVAWPGTGPHIIPLGRGVIQLEISSAGGLLLLVLLSGGERLRSCSVG